MTCGQESYIIETKESSNIAEITWQHDTQMLFVEFRNGSKFRYDGVSPEIAHGLQHAESKGGYFAKFIKGHYGAKRIEEAAQLCADCGKRVESRADRRVAGRACTASSSGGGCGESNLSRQLADSLKGGRR